MQDSGSNSNTCRAWVNFNGTGTVAILASFNVSSITDNGTGDYTVNFTNAMPDINYSVAGIGGPNSSAGTPIQIMENNLSARTTSSIRIWNLRSAGGGALDVATISVQIFR